MAEPRSAIREPRWLGAHQRRYYETNKKRILPAAHPADVGGWPKKLAMHTNNP